MNKFLLLGFATTLIVAFDINHEAMAQKRSLNRDEIPAEYKWNFNDIFHNWTDWEAALKQTGALMDEIASLKGTLKQGPQQLLKALKLQDEMGILAYKVYQYPGLMKNVDNGNAEIGGRLQQVQILFSKFGTATAWINPEMLTIPEATMRQWIDQTPDLKIYRFGLLDLYRQQKHVLDEPREQLLSYFSQLNNTPSDIYTMLTTADVKYPTIKLSDNKEVVLSPGAYNQILATDRIQADRRTAFLAHYGSFEEKKNTIASIYNAICQSDWASAQSRNYTSCLQAALDGNNIPEDVYKNLVNSVRENVAPLQRYMKLRARILKLEKYYGYDGVIPLVDFNKLYPYDDAKKMVIESVEPLGKDYVEKMKKAVASGWLDVYENKGKTTGAFSSNVYGVHPFMLLNYNETLNYVFTLAHELGHTLHSVLSNENQPFVTHNYTIFVAEVASTFNERLMLDYMLSKTKDPKERIALLTQAIDNIVGTFYTQVLFADFELRAHTLVEKGQPITVDVLNGIVADLYKEYYGDAHAPEPLYNLIWSRIPHFYNSPYYVYQYATCFASSAQIYNQVTSGTDSEKQNARERYLTLLKSGGNDYPMEQLKKAGVDLSKPEPIKAVITQLDSMVTLLEKELAKVK
ncbi:MAG: oligoendopeptidase F [Bacteroidota bacterium]|nr:oligoendopeptidase F [Bacteroidota bacterium]